MGGKSLKKSKESDGVIVLIYLDNVNMAKVYPIKVNIWLTDLVVAVRVVRGSSYGKPKVSCGSGQASLLMKDKKFGDYSIKGERFVPRVFQKGIVNGVDVDLSN